MPPKGKNAPAKPVTKGAARSVKHEAAAVVATLRRMGSRRIHEEMGSRYGIHVKKAFGIRVGAIQQLAKRLGRNHELALALWETGWYEARMIAAFVDEPQRVTPAQMERWRRDFDNWGIVDTVCFKLFDQSPHAWDKVEPWSRLSDEFGKRAGFVLLACLAAHDKQAEDAAFARCLPLIEKGAADERNFVKKGVSWALRMVGRRSPALHAESVTLARRLAASPNAAAKWIGTGALKELTSPAVVRRMDARRRAR